jgi:hypothetical protein
MTDRIRIGQKSILILDAGEAPYSLVAARSLGSGGHRVYLGFPQGSRVFEAYSRYCNGYLFYPDPSYAKEDFLRFFRGLVGKYDFILPTMEKTQLPISTIKDFLEQGGTCAPIPSYEILAKAADKTRVLQIAAENEGTFTFVAESDLDP